MRVDLGWGYTGHLSPGMGLHRSSLTYSDVLVTREHHPLVHLITDTNNIIACAEISNGLQLRSCKYLYCGETRGGHSKSGGYPLHTHNPCMTNLPNRVVWCVDDDHLGPGGEGCLQLLWV